MALALQQVSINLQAISSTLGNDIDIQGQINALLTTGNAISSRFSQAVRDDGGDLLRQKAALSVVPFYYLVGTYALMCAASPAHVDLEAMHSALQAAGRSFNNVKQDIFVMQASVHSNIEQCRGRRMAHEKSVNEMEASVVSLQGQIDGVTGNIATFEEDATDTDTAAGELEGRARDLQHQARKKRKKGIWGAVAGVVLAPFTGGMSLSLGVYAGVNMNDANDCSRKARGLREEAGQKRQQVENLRTHSQDLSNHKANMQSEVSTLRTRSVELENAAKSLGDVITSMHTSLQAMDAVIDALQGADVAFQQAKMQGDAFQIIQSAFNTNPQKLGGVADTHMDKLKEKWVHVERLLVKYGAIPLQ